MRIVFDYQTFFLQSYGGISRYYVRLAQGLTDLNEDVRIVAPLHRNRYIKDLQPKQVMGVEFSRYIPGSTRAIRSINKLVGGCYMRAISPDIIHETYYMNGDRTKAKAVIVTTVYDMIHEKFARDFSNDDRTAALKKSAVLNADHVICISHSTKKDLCELTGLSEQKASVVHLGCDAEWHSDGECDRLSRPFLLYVGNRNGYKNFLSTIKAVGASPRLRSEIDLVAFGGGAFTPQEKELLAQYGFSERSARQVSGDDNVLSQLYSSAAIFAYPSLYEGFGLPPLEAMAHDCPVVASNTSSMPEVIGDAGILFEPTSIDDQSRAIENVLYDGDLRKLLVQKARSRVKMFSWQRCAIDTLGIYRVLTGK